MDKMDYKDWIDNFSVKGCYDIASIRSNVTTQLEHFTHTQYGYCARVLDLVLLETIASIKGSLICKCHVHALVVLPCEGDVVRARVTNCSDKIGLYCTYENCIPLLVPYTRLRGYKYDGTHYLTRAGLPILVGDDITVMILKVRFQNGKYTAIGTINEEHLSTSESGC